MGILNEMANATPASGPMIEAPSAAPPRIPHSQRLLELQQRVSNLEKSLSEIVDVMKRLIESHGAEELQR